MTVYFQLKTVYIPPGPHILLFTSVYWSSIIELSNLFRDHIFYAHWWAIQGPYIFGEGTVYLRSFMILGGRDIFSYGTVYCHHLRNVYFSRPYILSRGPYISAQAPFIFSLDRIFYGWAEIFYYNFTKIFLISPRVIPFHQDWTNSTKILMISPRFFRFHQESTHFTKWEFHHDSDQDG